MKSNVNAIEIALAVLLSLSLFGCGENYSGTYYVNLASQPRWAMGINQITNNVTFSIDGAFLIEGEGRAYDNTMFLTAETNGSLNIFITFSDIFHMN